MLEGNRFGKKSKVREGVGCKPLVVCAVSRFDEPNNHLSSNYHRISFVDCCDSKNRYYGGQGQYNGIMQYDWIYIMDPYNGTD